MTEADHNALLREVLLFTCHLTAWYAWHTYPPAEPVANQPDHEARARALFAKIADALGYDLVAHGRTAAARLACAAEKSPGGPAPAVERDQSGTWLFTNTERDQLRKGAKKGTIGKTR